MKIAAYDTDLTDAQWTLVGPMLPPPRHLGRPRTDLRRILNALLYMAKAGCQWRLLPKEFPVWQTVYHVFRKWAREHVWEGLNARLRALVRGRAGKRSRPKVAILDSQSVKSDPHGGAVGYDAAKKIKGRKRHLLVDTLGLLLGVHVTPASTPAPRPCRPACCPGPSGCGSCGSTAATPARPSRLGPSLPPQARRHGRQTLRQGQRLTVLARRWVVERTFGWLMHHRRLVRDHETSSASAEALVLLAMIRFQIRRLA